MILFQYKKGKTFFHKIPASCKFFFLFANSFLAYFLTWPSKLILLCIFLFLAKLPWLSIKQNLKFLLFYTFFFFLVKSLGNSPQLLKENFFFVLSFMQNLAYLLFISSIFYERTSRFEILTFFETLAKFFKKERTLALIFTLIILCISEIFELYYRLNLAYEARKSSNSFLRTSYDKILVLFPALLEELLIFANNAYKSLENRS